MFGQDIHNGKLMQLTLARGDGLFWTGANTRAGVGRTVQCEITAIYVFQIGTL